jgi:hypothetical protein
MKKLYSYLLAGLAVLLVSGLSAQVTGITVTNTTPCPGESVTISWDIGSDGGTPFNISIVGSDASVVSSVSSDVFANTLDFTAVDGVTYTTFINGANGNATAVAPIVTNEAPSIPTGFTIDGSGVTKVCASTAFDLATTGEDLGTSGTIEWYANDETSPLNSGNPYNVAAGIVASTTYKVRVEDAVCGNNTAFFPVTVDVYVSPSSAATNVQLNGTNNPSPVCPGSYTLSAFGGNGGDNPATDTLFSTANPLVLGSGGSAGVVITYVDGCGVAPNQVSASFPVSAKTSSTAPTSVSVSNAGPVCSGTAITYTSVGGTNGTGVSYEYEVNGSGTWIADADGVIILNITEATSVAFRKIDDCNLTGTASAASASVDIYTTNTDVASVTHTAGADNEICLGGSVTFTAQGESIGTEGATYEYRVNEDLGGFGAWAATTSAGADDFHTVTISAASTTTVELRLVGGACTPDGLGAGVTVNTAADNVAPTTLTADIPTTCGDQTVTFTSDGTLGGNGAVFQFSTDIAFGSILQSSASNTYSTLVTADIPNMYVRILGGCNDVSGITPSASVDHVTNNVAPTSLTADFTTVCPGEDVMFTVDGTLGLGAVYEFDTDVAFGSVDETNMTGTYTVAIGANTTMYARISGGCNDVSPSTVSVDITTSVVSSPISSIEIEGAVSPYSACGDETVTVEAFGTTGPNQITSQDLTSAWIGYQVSHSYGYPDALAGNTASRVNVNAGSGFENTYNVLSNPVDGPVVVSFYVKTQDLASSGKTLVYRLIGGTTPQVGSVVVTNSWQLVTVEFNAASNTNFDFYPGTAAGSSNWNGSHFEVSHIKVEEVSLLGDGAKLQYKKSTSGTWNDAVGTSFDIALDAASAGTYNVRVNDLCDPAITADVHDIVLNHNVTATDDISIESSEDFDFCIANAPTAKTFTAKIGTIGTSGQLQYSTDNSTWFNTDDATNSSSFTIADITSVSNVYVQLVGSCNAGSIASVDSSVAVSVQADGTADVASDLPMANMACGVSTVEFDFDDNNDITLNDGMYVYAFTSFGAAADWSNSDTVTSNLLSGIVIDRDTTLHVQLIDCSGNVNTDSYDVDYKEPSDISGMVVTFTDVTDPLNPVTFDPSTDILCYDSDVTIKITGIVIGDGATLMNEIDGGGSVATSLIDTTVTINGIQLATDIEFTLVGSCNIVANPIVSETINVYPEIPEVTSLTIDKDNLCANDGEVVRLTAFTTVPVAFPYSYEWSKYKASNNTYTVIAGAPDAAIYDVTPDTITAYSVRIIGCGDTSAYVTRLVTIKDTSSVDGAVIVTNAGVDDKVCAGSLVTYNLSGGKKGFDAQLFWYNDNDVLVGQGNPFIMTVTQDTTLYAKYIGECNTTVNSVSKSIEVYEQSDVSLAFEAGNEFCVGSSLVLADTLIGTPLGGVYSGANVSGGVLTVQSGNNVVTYTFDFGGCSFSVNETIVGIEAPNASVVAGSIVNDACSGANVGEFKVEDIDNVGLTFELYLGATLLETETTTALDSIVTFDMLASGSYNVVVTNATGCQSVVNAVITSPAGLSAKVDTANSKLVVCNGETDGLIAIAAIGGVSPYMYSFNNGGTFGTSNTIANLDGSESLDIIVSDAAGCEFTVANGVSVFANTNVVSLTLENIVEPTCYDALDGRFDAVASGGFAPYMYSLDGVNFQSESRFDGLDVDVYTVTVSNKFGCTQDFISPLLGPDSLSVEQSIVSGDPISGYEVLFTVSGGNGGYEISINGGAFGTTFQFSQSSGDYTYEVRDVNGCSKSGSYELDGVDGINNINDVVSSVYPNPFTSTLTLVGANMLNAEVVFTDINGKVLAVEMEVSNDKVVIATSDVAKGIYLVKVVTKSGSTVKRVVKN